MARLRLTLQLLFLALCFLCAYSDQVVVLHPSIGTEGDTALTVSKSAEAQRPFRTTVRQYDGNATLTVILEVATVRQSEMFENAVVKPTSTPILTRWNISAPWRRSETGRWRLRLSVHFRGALGLQKFFVIVKTDNSAIQYAASFRVTVAGVAVMFGRRAVSGKFKLGLGLGPYFAWTRISQFALPVVAVGSDGQFVGLPVGDGVVLALRRNAGVNAMVDSVRFDQQKCSKASGVSVTEDVGEVDAGANTIFALGAEKITLGRVDLLDECGLALSNDGKWLVVRLEPYRVSGYGFVVQIIVKNSTSSNIFPNRLNTNLFFDEDVPPPVILNTSISLDPYGGEVFQIPLTNVANPPQRRKLQASAFSLELNSKNENDSRRFPAEKLVRIGDVSGDRNVHELHIQTSEWIEQANQEVEANLTVAKVDDKLSERRRPNYFIPNPFRQPLNASNAVVSPGQTLVVRVASAQLARTDSCDQNDDRYEKDQFIIVRLRVSKYNETTYSDHKKQQLSTQIRSYFPGVTEEAVRLVEVGSGFVTYALCILKGSEGDDLTGSMNALRKSISDEVFCAAVQLRSGDVVGQNISVVRQSLCKAFPQLEASNSNRISGNMIRLIPLWVVLGIAAIAAVSALVLRYGKAALRAQGMFLESTTWDLQTLDDFHDMSDVEYDPDATPTAQTPATSEQFPESTKSSPPRRGRPPSPTEGQGSDSHIYPRFDRSAEQTTISLEPQTPVLVNLSDIGTASTNSMAGGGIASRLISSIRSGLSNTIARFKREDSSISSQTPHPRIFVEQVWVPPSSPASQP